MPQKQKITAEEKVRIVEDYQSSRISISEAARTAGVSRETVKTWINIYENEGIEGFIHHGQKEYSTETKIAAVLEYLHGGVSQQEICKKYGIRGKCSSVNNSHKLK